MTKKSDKCRRVLVNEILIKLMVQIAFGEFAIYLLNEINLKD